MSCFKTDGIQIVGAQEAEGLYHVFWHPWRTMV